MLQRGVYPAAVTPLGTDGKIDMPGVARLLAFFEAKGCTGAVLAGTNGEGPSLSAVEKRDLIRLAMPMRGKLELILGIATSSLDEAKWSCEQGARAGAAAALVMAPSYFREASEAGISAWFQSLLDSSPLPLILYNFPQRTGVELTPSMLKSLASHEKMAGVKDSSGSKDNVAAYAAALPNKLKFMGNETLLWDALEAGWTGTISGAANVLPGWLSQVVAEFGTESGRAKFDLILPCIEAMRKSPQPGTNKALLHRAGILPLPALRLPLTPPEPAAVEDLESLITARLGNPLA